MAAHQSQSGQHWHVSQTQSEANQHTSPEPRRAESIDQVSFSRHICCLCDTSAVTQLFQLPSLVGTPDAKRPNANYLDFQGDSIVDWDENAPHILLSQRLASIAKL